MDLKHCYNEMRAISLSELNNWLVENKKHTHYLGKDGGFSEGSTHLIHYLEFVLDTRTMSVYYIKFKVHGNPMVCTTANQMLDPIIQANRFASLLDYLNHVVKMGSK